jgi:hypothetical protein
VRAAEAHARHDVDALAAEVLAMEAGSDAAADTPVEARFDRPTAPVKAAAAMEAATPAAVTAAPTTVFSATPAVLPERRRRDRDTDEARKAKRERDGSPPIHGRLLSTEDNHRVRFRISGTPRLQGEKPGNSGVSEVRRGREVARGERLVGSLRRAGPYLSILR